MNALSDPDPTATADPLRRHRGWLLAALAVALALSLVFMFTDSGHPAADGGTQFGTLGDVGMVLYFVVYAGLIVADARAFVRSIAAHRWVRSVQGGASVVLAGLLYVLVVPYVVAFYPLVGIVQYARGYLADRQRLPLDRQRRIAELEAGLDIEPGTEGNCPKCGKPLQVDAEFCAFCGARVKQEPVVCPRCATVALPGAKWCPKCGAPLEGAPARA